MIINFWCCILSQKMYIEYCYFLFIFLGSVTTVESVVGMMTNLPCNITPSLPDDKIQLVLWYKVISLETPIE